MRGILYLPLHIHQVEGNNNYLCLFQMTPVAGVWRNFQNFESQHLDSNHGPLNWRTVLLFHYLEQFQ